jgi:hypothetical protein
MLWLYAFAGLVAVAFAIALVETIIDDIKYRRGDYDEQCDLYGDGLLSDAGEHLPIPGQDPDSVHKVTGRL